MVHKHTKRHRTRRTRGAGYGFQLSGSLPGIADVSRYTGPGKDCAQMPTVSSKSFGLPGLSGGSRRRRHQGGTYGFTAGASDLMTSVPFERIGCRGMRGGANTMNPSYYAATAGYSTQPEIVPGSAGAGFLRTVAYPDKAFTPACMRGGSRRNRTRRNRTRRNRTRRNRTRRNH